MPDYPVRTDQQIALLIRSFRKARGLTQDDLAQALGVTQQAASALERNPSVASVGRLLRTLSAMDVELVFREKGDDSVEKPAAKGKQSAKRSTKTKSSNLDW